MEIVVLQKDELETLLRRVADAAVEQLRDDIARVHTPELMTMSQICDYLQCHRSTVTRHIGQGMPVEHAGEQQRFRKTDIDLWLRGEHERKNHRNGSDENAMPEMQRISNCGIRPLGT